MLAKLTNKELELLSAYLDGEAAPDQEAIISQRLEADPDFAQALLELKQLKNTLSTLPKPKLRRHFTLGPEYERVNWRQRFGIANSWGTLSAVASFLLAMVFVGELVAGGGPFKAAGGELASAKIEVAEDQVFAEVAPADESEAFPEEALGAQMTEDMQAESAAVPEEDSSNGIATGPADPQAAGGGAIEGGQEPTDVAPMDQSSSDEGLMDEESKDEEPKALILEEAAERSLPETPAIPMITYFRWLELGLALIALTSLLMAWRRDRVQ